MKPDFWRDTGYKKRPDIRYNLSFVRALGQLLVRQGHGAAAEPEARGVRTDRPTAQETNIITSLVYRVTS